MYTYSCYTLKPDKVIQKYSLISKYNNKPNLIAIRYGRCSVKCLDSKSKTGLFIIYLA